jgi:hypothetical protein
LGKLDHFIALGKKFVHDKIFLLYIKSE